MTGSTAAVLPLHHGTVLLPTTQHPNLVTKNSNDGELIKLPSADGAFGILRRHEQDIDTWSDGGYHSWPNAVACLADRQAFGYRQNGQSATMTNTDPRSDTIEIEPLNIGAVLFQNQEHLPIGIYLDTAETYRLRTGEATEDEYFSGGETVGILEHRQDNHSSFERLEQVEEIRHLATVLTEYAPVEATTDPSWDNLKSIINEHYNEDETFKHAGDDPEVMETAAIQDTTTLPPNHPAPAPLFPEANNH